MSREDFFHSLHVSRETSVQFQTYADLLLQWNASINLIGPSTEHDIWQRHFLDSAQLVPYLTDKNAPILDVGTGAGFPGMVLALLGYRDVTLVDSDHRKCAFLREVAAKCCVTPTIYASRLEKIPPRSYTYIVSRGCARLDTLLHMVSSFLDENAIMYFHKGKNCFKEIETLSDEPYNIITHKSLVSEESVILEIIRRWS